MLRPIRRCLTGLALATVLVAGCDIPTSTPILQQRWAVPTKQTSISVDELLPDGVSLAPDEAGFRVDMEPVSLSQALSDLCSACIALNGLVAPKPAFDTEWTTTADLPADVSGAQLRSGSVRTQTSHDFAFDPLRPTAGSNGSLVFQIRDGIGGPVIGEASVSGTTQAFPQGSSLELIISIESASVGAVLEVVAQLVSPAGDNVTINTSAAISVTATPEDIEVLSATVDVSGQSVQIDPEELDVEDISDSIVDDIVSGGFELDIENPFGVSVTIDLIIEGPTIQSIQKSFVVTADAQSEVRIEFTREELQRFLGQPGVVLRGEGVVQSDAGDITVSPGQEAILETTLDIILDLGG